MPITDADKNALEAVLRGSLIWLEDPLPGAPPDEQVEAMAAREAERQVQVLGLDPAEASRYCAGRLTELLAERGVERKVDPEAFQRRVSIESFRARNRIPAQSSNG